jgi:hypothetical protein
VDFEINVARRGPVNGGDMPQGEPPEMSKRFVISVALFVAIALAFGAGLLVQRQFQLVPLRIAEQFTRDLAGLDDPIPAAPQWEAWRYPNADTRGNIQGSSTRINEKLVRPSARYFLCTTSDALEDVARFYAEKAGFSDVDKVAKSTSGVSSQGTLKGDSNHVLDDFDDPKDPQAPRPVRSKCLIRRCPSYDLTVFVTRADSENHTHILILYDPKTEAAAAAEKSDDAA